MENNNGWVTVVSKKGQRHNGTIKKNKKNNKNKSRNNKGARRKEILRKLFNEEEELPDELSTLSLAITNNANNTSNNNNNNSEPEKEPEALGEEDKERFQKALVNFFRDGYIKNVSKGSPASDETILEHINNILVQYGIKISGGFVLKNIGMFEGESGASSIDIDIYLPFFQGKNTQSRMKRTQTIHKLLQDLLDVDKIKDKPVYKYFKVSDVGVGKSAFFTKNGIYSVTKYSSKGGKAEMDLVQADRNTTPIDIIRRFDLTFCQNWYDGEEVWSMDKEAVYKNDAGLLEDSYVPLYLGGNIVTRRRIAKYIGRGFRVKYHDPNNGELIEITLDDLKNVV